MARRSKTAMLKRQRERDKAEKAEQKRARRQDRQEQSEGSAEVASEEDLEAFGVVVPEPGPGTDES